MDSIEKTVDSESVDRAVRSRDYEAALAHCSAWPAKLNKRWTRIARCALKNSFAPAIDGDGFVRFWFCGFVLPPIFAMQEKPCCTSMFRNLNRLNLLSINELSGGTSGFHATLLNNGCASANTRTGSEDFYRNLKSGRRSDNLQRQTITDGPVRPSCAIQRGLPSVETIFGPSPRPRLRPFQG